MFLSDVDVFVFGVLFISLGSRGQQSGQKPGPKSDKQESCYNDNGNNDNNTCLGRLFLDFDVSLLSSLLLLLSLAFLSLQPVQNLA